MKMLTPNEVATLTGLSRYHVIEALTSGKLHGIRLGTGRGTWAISEDDLARFLAGDFERPKVATR